MRTITEGTSPLLLCQAHYAHSSVEYPNRSSLFRDVKGMLACQRLQQAWRIMCAHAYHRSAASSKSYYAWLLLKFVRKFVCDPRFAGPENWFFVLEYFDFVADVLSLPAVVPVDRELLPGRPGISVRMRPGVPSDKVPHRAEAPATVMDARFYGIHISTRVYGLKPAAEPPAMPGAAAPGAAAVEAEEAAQPAPVEVEFDAVTAESDDDELAAEMKERSNAAPADEEMLQDFADEADEDAEAEDANAAAAVEPAQPALAPQPDDWHAQNPFHYAVERRGKVSSSASFPVCAALTRAAASQVIYPLARFMHRVRQYAVFLGATLRTENVHCKSSSQTAAPVELRHRHAKYMWGGHPVVCRNRSLVEAVINTVKSHKAEEAALLLGWVNAHAPVSTRRFAALQQVQREADAREKQQEMLKELGELKTAVMSTAPLATGAAARSRIAALRAKLGGSAVHTVETMWGDGKEPAAVALEHLAGARSDDAPEVGDDDAGGTARFGDDSDADGDAEMDPQVLPKLADKVARLASQVADLDAKAARSAARHATQCADLATLQSKLHDAEREAHERRVMPLRPARADTCHCGSKVHVMCGRGACTNGACCRLQFRRGNTAPCELHEQRR